MSCTGCPHLTGLRQCSSEQGLVPRPLLGQPSLSVRLDLQERDGGKQSANAIQNLFDLTIIYS